MMDADGLRALLDTATMARTPFEIRYFVAGRHVHPVRQFRQLLVELQVAEGAIRACEIGQRRRDAQRRKIDLEVAEIEASEYDAEKRACEIDLKQCDRDDLDLAETQERRALAGKIKEVAYIRHLLETEYRDWVGLSEVEQLRHERDYWVQRLARQAANDIAACGRIGEGNIAALRMLPEAERHEALKLACLEDMQHQRDLPRVRDEALKVASDEARSDALLAHVDEATG